MTGTRNRTGVERARRLETRIAVIAAEHARNRRILSGIVPTNWIPHIVTSTKENRWASQVMTSSKNAAAKITTRFICFSSVRNANYKLHQYDHLSRNTSVVGPAPSPAGDRVAGIGS